VLQSAQGDRLSDLISRRHFYIEMLPLEFDSDSQVAKDKPMTSPHTSYSININELDEILGARPILPTESAKAYDVLTDKFREAVVPRDIVEEILVRDAIDLTWEIQRLKDFKCQLMLFERAENIKAVLDKIFGTYGYDPKLCEAYAENNPLAIKTMKTELATRGYDVSIFDAISYRRQLDEFAQLDRQILQAEARRAAHLKEVDRHRSALADQMRETFLAIDKSRAADDDTQN